MFVAYAIAAAPTILETVAMSWLAAARMMRANAGFRAPEGLRRTLLNPQPHPTQLEPNDAVERVRRIQLNDVENVPFFRTAGPLFVFTQPTLLVAQCLYYGYGAPRFAHFGAYISAQTHDLRAALWTPGSLILIYMAARTLTIALGR